MKIELKMPWLKKLAKKGGTEFNDFSYLGDDRYAKIDLERCTEKDVTLLAGILEEVKTEPGARAAKLKISAYLKIKADPAGAKISRLEALVAAIKTYVGKSEHKWLFADNADDQTVPFFVISVKYTEPDERHGNPASTTMSLGAVRGGEKYEKSVSWSSDELGKSVVELLNDAGYYLETPEIVKVYEAEVAQYRKLSQLTGDQFLAYGSAFSRLDRYDRRVVSMVRDDAPAKLVMDDLWNDHDDSERDTITQVIVNGSFWSEKAKDGRSRRDDDEEEVVAVLPLHPYANMFDLAKHTFVSIHVNNLKPYVYDNTLIEKLVLPQEEKDLVSMLISGADTRMEDIIKGKTGGIITISTGPAGTGKTLTAEVFAEEMKRPLYAVQCSQLGTDEESLEKQLQKVLRRATRWRAILLIDEADVYVHARGEDIQQNAIVGVFLRVLEYYRGILFMTSNRDTVIDDAILSRATAWIRYHYPTPENLAKIWQVLSENYKIALDAKEIQKLVNSKKIIRPSGRSVKNLLKLAKLLSLKSKKAVDATVIEYVSKFIALDHPLDGPLVPGSDKHADALGQIIFRLETNLESMKRNVVTVGGPDSAQKHIDLSEALTNDLERLKELKVKLLAA